MPAGWIARCDTKVQSALLAGLVCASWFHDTPPSIDFRTPNGAYVCVPYGFVDAYMICALTGLLRILPIDSEPLKSLTADHEVPPSVVFQMPPPSVPAHIVRVVGVPTFSISRSLTRPTGCT